MLAKNCSGGCGAPPGVRRRHSPRGACARETKDKRFGWEVVCAIPNAPQRTDQGANRFADPGPEGTAAHVQECWSGLARARRTAPTFNKRTNRTLAPASRTHGQLGGMPDAGAKTGMHERSF
jgi:hypothetical protein